MSKKVLIITYYWIPSGGAGVQRWVKFAKYLRSFGWEPIIYTPENPEFPSIDHSFEKDIPSDIQVIKTPIWEPYNVYRNLIGKKNQPINAGFISENKKSGWKDKLSIWIRGNFLIPDPRRFWIKPSVHYLTKYLKSNPVDAIITTGPPHSMHFIGLGLKKEFPNIPWLADFRDPWTNIDFYKDLNLSYISDKIHHRLEKKVIQNADCILVVSNGMKEEYELMNPKLLKVIPNGFDDSDTLNSEIQLDRKFSISHIGTLNVARNPTILWKVLSEICTENLEFKNDLQIQLVGKVDFSILENIQDAGLQNQLLKIDYLSHSEAIEKQQCSQILMLLINNSGNAKGILTGKFFEYLAAKRPIFAIGPIDGDAAEVLKKTGAGFIVDFNDENGTKKVILDFYKQYKTNSLNIKSDSVEQYSRKSLTKDLATLLNSL
ncbi:MAG: glycosyltransferase [Paludibacter sp.]